MAKPPITPDERRAATSLALLLGSPVKRPGSLSLNLRNTPAALLVNGSFTKPRYRPDEDKQIAAIGSSPPRPATKPGTAHAFDQIGPPYPQQRRKRPSPGQAQSRRRDRPRSPVTGG